MPVKVEPIETMWPVPRKTMPTVQALEAAYRALQERQLRGDQAVWSSDVMAARRAWQDALAAEVARTAQQRKVNEGDPDRWRRAY